MKFHRLLLALCLLCCGVQAVVWAPQFYRHKPTVSHSKRNANYNTTLLSSSFRESLASFESTIGRMNGLQVWSRMAASARLRMRRTLWTKNEMSLIVQYYMPLIVFCSVIFALGFVASLVGASTLCCCGKRFKQRRIDAYSVRRRVFYLFVFGLALFTILVACISGIQGSVVFTKGLSDTVNGINSALDDMYQLTIVGPTVTAATNTLSSALDDTLNSIVTTVTTGITANANLTAKLTAANTSVISLHNQIQGVLATGSSVETSFNSFLNLSATIQNATIDLRTTLDQLNLPVREASNVGTFEIIAKFSIPPGIDNSTLLKDIGNGSIPNIKDSMAKLSGPNIPDLLNISRQVTSKYDGLTTTIQELIVGNNSEIKVSTRNQINNAKASIESSSDSSLGSVRSSIVEAQKSVAQANIQLASYDKSRAAVTVLLFTLALFFIVCISTMLAFRSPKAMKTCAVGTTALWIPLYLVCILFLILATVFGDGIRFPLNEACYYFIETAAGSTLIANMGIKFGSANLQQIYDARAECRNNVSLLTIGSNLGLFNANSNEFNMTFQIQKVVDEQDWNGTIAKQDFSSVIPRSLLDDIKNGFSPSFVNDTLASINAIVIRPEFDANKTSVLDQSTIDSLFQLRGNISVVMNNLTPALFAFTPVLPAGAAGTARANLAMNQYRQMCQASIDKIDMIFGANSTSYNSRLNAERASLRISVQNVYNQTSNTLAFTNTTMTRIEDVFGETGNTITQVKSNLLNTVPTIKSNLVSSAKTVQKLIDQQTQCDRIAQDIDMIQNGLCVSVLYSLDAFWLGFLVLAFTGCYSLPFFIGVANGVANRFGSKPDKDREYDDQFYDDEEKSGSKKGSVENI